MSIIWEQEPKSGNTANELWHDRISHTIRHVEHHYHERWKKNLHIDRGEDDQGNLIFPGLASSPNSQFDIDRRTPVNLTGLYTRKLLSYLIYQDPLIMLDPTIPEDYVSAQLQQIKVNKEWERCKIKKTMTRAGLRALIFGSGVVEVGYNGDVPHTKKEETHGSLEYRDMMKPGKIFVRNVEVGDFFFDLDPPEQDLESARYCFERIWVTPEALFSNTEFNQQDVLAKIQDGGAGYKTEVWTDKGLFKKGERPGQYICVYRLWDKKFRQFLIFVRDVLEPIHIQPWPYKLESLPYMMFSPLELPGDCYGLGYAVWPEGLQKQINRSVSSLFEYAHTAMSGTIQAPEGTKKEEAEAVLQGKKLVFHPLTGKFEPVFQGQFNGEVLRAQEIGQRYMDMFYQMNEIMFGAQAAPRTSAQEISTRTNFLMTSIQDLVGKVDDFTKGITQYMLGLMKQYYTKEEMLPVAGPLAEYWGEVTKQKPKQTPDGQFWVPYTTENIRAATDVKIVSTSAPKMDPLSQSEREMIFFQRVLLPATNLAAMVGQAGMTLESVGGINIYAFIQKMAENIGFKDVPRFLPKATVLKLPIQTQTAAEAGAVPGSNGTGAPVVSPMSEIAGGLSGGLEGFQGGRPAG